ncbi:acyl--CoA ligase [Yinghuangia sp. ASG 101]|uniref:class I adenylate-forming enzyme family protein n=1 Tax=Yinghuangia sp. ASG 101 TaxID=2896848 RepID=UPI001E3FBA81|nr:class I adenylate-forming enzyme family protein [Yinghuangia sp. ASG 101]UGQ12500.1 acyl--CoA ligase [Yinghuangia sp. ASG 101]
MTATRIHADDDLPLTVPLVIRRQAARYGTRTLLTSDDDNLTYAEADRRSRELARGLLALGAGKGTHVGLLYPDGAEFVVAALAAARIGAVTVPLSTLSTPSELGTLLRDGDVGILLATGSYRSHDHVEAVTVAVPGFDASATTPLFAASAPVLRHVFFSDAPGVAASRTLAHLITRGAEVGEDVARAAEEAVDPSDRLVIVHTSGSTGAPKGVVHAHGPMLRHLDNLNEMRRYTPDDVLYSNSPYFWIGGYAYVMLGTLLAGARVLASNAARPADVLAFLERERPTMVNGYVQSIARLAADPTFAGRDLSFIRRGNLYPIMPDDVRPADPALRHQMLGMTETGGVCLASDDETDQPEHRRGSFGHPAPGFETRIADFDGGADPGPGQRGELLLRGPFMMEGYHGRERDEVFDADGWYHSGDTFSIDDEGFCYFHGRRGDMIKTAGANVSPIEVADAIRAVSGLDALVVGVADAERGQIVAAAVRVRDDSAPAPDELRRRLAEHLSAYKIPRRIVLIADDEVPTQPSGKIDIPALKELLGADT